MKKNGVFLICQALAYRAPIGINTGTLLSLNSEHRTMVHFVFSFLWAFLVIVSVWSKECPSRAFIEQSLKDVNVPGAAIIVVNATNILYQEAFGYQSLSPARMMDVDKSIFLLASLSKTFIGVAVMQLVEANRLDLDADINEYLPSTKTSIVHPKYPCNKITLRHLLSHSASVGVDQKIGFTFIRPNDPWLVNGTTLEDVCYDYLSPNVSNWLSDPPGSISLYSNVGTALAGLIVERVAQMPYELYVREKILKPLGIDVKRAGYRLSDIENRDDLVKHYAFNASSLALWKQELPQINVSKVRTTRTVKAQDCSRYFRPICRIGSPFRSLA